jgi:cell division protein FtsB
LDNPLKVKELQDKVDTLKKEIANLKTRNIELEALVDGTDAVQQEEVLNGEDAA